MSRTQRPSALRLLWRDLAASALTFMGVAISIGFSFILLGFAFFGVVMRAQLQRHFRLAFDSETRSSWLPAALAALVAGLAVAVFVGWMALAHDLWQSQLLRDSHTNLAVVGMLPVYALAAWVLAPFLFLGVVALDPRAPADESAQLSLALRAAVAVPFLQRLAAVVLTGVWLLGPVVAGHFTGSLLFLPIGAIALCSYPSVASAFLVSRYALVREAVVTDATRVLRVPSFLVALSIAALAASVGAAFRAPHHLPWLGVAWFLAANFGIAFVVAHRLARVPTEGRVRAGRRALQGVIETAGGKRLFRSGALTIPLPDGAADLDEGAPATLIGDFSAYREGFRESATQPWPARATLHPGSFDDVIERRVARATWLASAVLAATTLYALATALFG